MVVRSLNASWKMCALLLMVVRLPVGFSSWFAIAFCMLWSCMMLAG